MAVPPEPFSLVFEQRRGYLYAEVRAAQITEEAARNYLGQIAEQVSATRTECVLIFRDIPVILSDTVLFDVTNYFLDLMAEKRIAFVNPHSEIREDMEFAIRIGTNRGAYYALFADVDEAAKWLLDPSGLDMLETHISVDPSENEEPV